MNSFMTSPTFCPTSAFDNQTAPPFIQPTKASQRAIPKQVALLFPIPRDIFLSRDLELYSFSKCYLQYIL